jgi:hypothetical protein
MARYRDSESGVWCFLTLIFTLDDFVVIQDLNRNKLPLRANQPRHVSRHPYLTATVSEPLECACDRMSKQSALAI